MLTRLSLLCFLLLITFTTQAQYYKPWVWVDGPAEGGSTGSFGEKGIPKASNYPSSREQPISWVAPNGHFYLFGGLGVDANSSRGPGTLNDLWKWDGQNWTWVDGTKEISNEARPGAVNVVNPNFYPGYRNKSSYCVGSDGTFWLYGGWGYNRSGKSGVLSDLWKWDGKHWIRLTENLFFMALPNYPSGANPLGIGQNPGNRMDAAMWADANGVVWLFGGFSAGRSLMSGIKNDMWKFENGEWEWVHGTKDNGDFTYYGEKNKPHPDALPEGRRNAATWQDLDGNFYIFGGNNNKPMDDVVWRWNGKAWAWIAGTPGAYNQAPDTAVIGKPHPDNTPGSRSNMSTWTDQQGHLWIFGGLGRDLSDTTEPRRLNDLWEFNNKEWICHEYHDTTERFAIYGTKGVADSANRPGARMNMAAWRDRHGDLWLMGGLGYDSTAEDIQSDMWYRQIERPRPRMVVYGKNQKLHNGQTQTQLLDNTHFGQRTSQQPAKHQRFTITNNGNRPLTFRDSLPIEIVWQNSAAPSPFSLHYDSIPNVMNEYDSFTFHIAFKPTASGRQEATVLIHSNDSSPSPFSYIISGLSLQPRLKNQVLNCSEVQLRFSHPDYHLSTLLLSHHGEKYISPPPTSDGLSYSPNYLLASDLNNYSKVMHQDDDTLLTLHHLVASRRYTLVHVPTTDSAGQYYYHWKERQITTFSLDPPNWASQVAMSPSADSSFCPGLSQNIQANSPYPVKWMDEKTDTQRSFKDSALHYFIAEDLNGCIVSSDSARFRFADAPHIHNFGAFTHDQTPFCEGDTVGLVAYSTDSVYWQNHGNDTMQAWKAGYYHAIARNSNGCSVRDSFLLEYWPKPVLSSGFPDSILVVNQQLQNQLNVEPNHFWTYKGTTYEQPSHLPFENDSQDVWLHLSNENCTAKRKVLVMKISTDTLEHWIPNAFSPNDDGINDKWMWHIKGSTYEEVIVFDRWGEKLYTGNGPWDGRKNGVALPVGTYLYVLQYRLNGEKQQVSGKVAIVK